MPTLEVRAGLELRTVDGGRRLEGIAAPFNRETRIGAGAGSFREVIKPGAFTRTLASGKDVLALAGHDTTRVLARTANGSLRLHANADGLAFSLDLADTSIGRDIRTMAESRLLGGMSFAFRPAPGGDTWPQADLRELRDLDLEEISVVQAHPAYSGTEVHARARHAGQVPPAIIRRRRLLASL